VRFNRLDFVHYELCSGYLCNILLPSSYFFSLLMKVTLGRETEDVKVDIDLGKEGRANKISRRQVIP
jgi:hypothetical protein